jgi:hypothetical protein
MSDRITAAELEALVKVMRENQVVDLASGDTRIVMSSYATLPMPGAPVDPMRPIAAASTSPLDATRLADDEEDLLFASTPLGAPP